MDEVARWNYASEDDRRWERAGGEVFLDQTSAYCEEEDPKGAAGLANLSLSR